MKDQRFFSGERPWDRVKDRVEPTAPKKVDGGGGCWREAGTLDRNFSLFIGPWRPSILTVLMNIIYEKVYLCS